MDLRNIKLAIEYDGTAYSGWQIQDNAIAVQNVVEEAIFLGTEERVQLIGAGRTDKGVHALGQVANFFTRSQIPADAYRFILNDKLPEDVFIRESIQVPMEFHSRYSAKKKTYRYVVHNGAYLSPLERLYKIHIRKKLDMEAMLKGKEILTGRHDFRSFMSAKAEAKVNTVRRINRIDILQKEEDFIFTFEAESFLYNQVRIMAACLIRLGMGKITLEDLQVILEAKNREKAGSTFPAKGLTLMQIDY